MYLHCAFGIPPKACLPQCLLRLMPVSNSTRCLLLPCQKTTEALLAASRPAQGVRLAPVALDAHRI